MARRLIAAYLIMFGMIIAQVGAFVWWIDREIVEPERLADVTTTIVRDREFREAVAPEVVDRLLGEEATNVLGDDRDVIVAAVAAAMADPEVVNTVGTAIEDFASAVMGRTEGPIAIELAGVQTATVATLTEIDKGLATSVAGLEPPKGIELDVDRFPSLATPISVLSLAWLGAMGIGGSAALLGMLIHPKPAKGLRRIGALLAIGAGIQLGLAWVGTEVVAVNIGGSGVATAGRIGLGVVLDGWRIQAMAQLVAGVALAVVGHVLLWIPMLGRAASPATA